MQTTTTAALADALRACHAVLAHDTRPQAWTDAQESARAALAAYEAEQAGAEPMTDEQREQYIEAAGEHLDADYYQLTDEVEKVEGGARVTVLYYVSDEDAGIDESVDDDERSYGPRR